MPANVMPPLEADRMEQAASPTAAQAEFRRKGFLTGFGSVTSDELAMLKDVCNRLLDEPVDDGGNGRHRIGLGKDRQFLAHRHPEFPDLERFLVEGTAAKAASQLLGNECMLFNEQFVVKGPQSGASFAWHQDSAYVGHDHEPYVSVWIALDDTTIENGCLFVMDRDLDREGHVDRHVWIEDSRELNGYDGDDPGKSVVCPAGEMVAFSSLTLHRSGPNSTGDARRAYLAQYSASPIRNPETGELKRFAKAVRTAC